MPPRSQLSPKDRAFIADQKIFFVATAPLSPDGFVNLSPKGLSNTLAIIDDSTLAYLDLTGSGVETIAHLQENKRIVLMFCAFQGPPNILRIHGLGSVLQPTPLPSRERSVESARPGEGETLSNAQSPHAPNHPATTDRESAAAPSPPGEGSPNRQSEFGNRKSADSHSDFDSLMSFFPPLPGVRSIIRIHITRIADSCGTGVPLYSFTADRDALINWANKKGPQGIADYQRSKNSRSLNNLPGLHSA